MHDTDLMEDNECIARYLGGDANAMDVVVNRYRSVLFWFILTMTGPGADADDVFQETWFRALRALPRYRDRNLRGWLLRIARNVHIDRVRKRKEEVSLDQETPDGFPVGSTLAGTGDSPDQEVSSLEIGRKIASAVNSLPSEQREVFMLRMRAGVTFREIADAQGVSINTVLARMQYALRKLRSELAEDYLILVGNAGEG
jgi:RNA polymerase sigma-70 factor (ECF subfamily)